MRIMVRFESPLTLIEKRLVFAHESKYRSLEERSRLDQFVKIVLTRSVKRSGIRNAGRSLNCQAWVFIALCNELAGMASTLMRS